MLLRHLQILSLRPEIVSRRYAGTAEASTAFALTISTASVSNGATATPTTSKSPTITKERPPWLDAENTMAAHPGEILRTEFMEPLGVTAYQLAKALHLPGMYEIVRGKRAISADVALRLGKYFSMTPQFWMNLQTTTIYVSRQ